jgi:hypothetical protein
VFLEVDEAHETVLHQARAHEKRSDHGSLGEINAQDLEKHSEKQSRVRELEPNDYPVKYAFCAVR